MAETTSRLAPLDVTQELALHLLKKARLRLTPTTVTGHIGYARLGTAWEGPEG